MKDVYGPAHIDYGKFNPVKTSTYGENFYNKDGANFGKNKLAPKHLFMLSAYSWELDGLETEFCAKATQSTEN